MVSKIEILKVLGCLSVMALASAPAFAADPSQDPNNPNCSPGVKGCTANYATSDTTSSNPTTPYSGSGNPNCSPGQQGCTANYATTDHSGDNPNKPPKPAN
jgi:hypothetical protein